MANVILFRPRFLNSEASPPPVPWGLLFVGSALTARGYSVKIVDELLHPNWKNLILEELGYKPAFIGVSAMTGRQIRHGLELAAFVKQHSSVPVVWGGIHPSLFPRQTLSHDHIDYVVLGEGEQTVLELMAHFVNGMPAEGIRGLGYKKNLVNFLNEPRPFPELDALPDIDYSLIDVNRYTGRRFGTRRSFELCTSRGCPHRCSFCYNVNHYRCTWRAMSIERIFRALHTLIDAYSIDSVTWREDNFFVDRNRVQVIAERILREGIRIRWHADCRIDDVCRYDDAFLGLLKRSGCHTLTLGAESGSNSVLKRINKGITREQILTARDKLTRHGIYQNFHFMLGLPDETEDDIRQTIELMGVLMRKNPYFGEICGPSLYTPYPGTPLYDESLVRGFNPPDSLEGWIDMDWYSLHLPWITAKRKATIEDIAWNVMGMRQRGARMYFKWKFHLLARYRIHVPCFERKIFLRLKKGC